MAQFRIEKDSMGEINIPSNALYGAQTQRAIDNFPISHIKFSRPFIKSLGLIKLAAAKVNCDLNLLNCQQAKLIEVAAQKVADGLYDHDFPIDIYQTGSGTSTNMNANEVIANRANQIAQDEKIDIPLIHPNDHVNFGQSSNDVIPTAIRISAVIETREKLLPALCHLRKCFLQKGKDYSHVVKTGRTHLMDAMPITFEQQFSGYARQLELAIERIEYTLNHIQELPQGGTAVGTGINTHKEFAARFAQTISQLTNFNFAETKNHFEAQSTIDSPAALSDQLKLLATGLIKIANDLRWMNSGPLDGLGEIELAALQPGSSIMPGKVNPVIEESVLMVCAQVIGNNTAITIAAQSGNFELNVMLPVVAHNLLESIRLLTNVTQNFADRSISKIKVREENIKRRLDKNPILVTTLTPIIGYELATKIAKEAIAQDRSIKDIAKEMTNLTDDELTKLLDPLKMTQGGFN